MSGIKAMVMASILLLLYITIVTVPASAPSLVTIDDVIDYVHDWHQYELNVFDCSNQAAMFFELVTSMNDTQQQNITLCYGANQDSAHMWVCIDGEEVFGGGNSNQTFPFNYHDFTRLEDANAFLNEAELEWRSLNGSAA